MINQHSTSNALCQPPSSVAHEPQSLYRLSCEVYEFMLNLRASIAMLRSGIDSGHRSVSFSIRRAVTIVYHIVNEYFSPLPTTLSRLSTPPSQAHVLRSHVWPMNSCFLTFVAGLGLSLPLSFHSNRPVQAVLLRRSRIISTAIILTEFYSSCRLRSSDRQPCIAQH